MKLGYLRYPQRGWACTIALWMRELSLTDRRYVDAPCGDGIVSYWLARELHEARIEARDLSSQATALAAMGLCPWRTRVQVQQGAICDLATDSGNDVWLLINSLFLLPDPYGEIARLRLRFEYIVIVIPDIHARNYELYMRRSNAQRNPHALEPSMLNRKLSDLGYAEQRSTYLSPYASYAFDQPGLRRLAPPLLALMDPGPVSKGNYWLGLYRRVAH